MLIPQIFKPISRLCLEYINIEEGGKGGLQSGVIIGVRSLVSIDWEKIDISLCFANNFVVGCLRITNSKDKKNKFPRDICCPKWYSMIREQQESNWTCALCIFFMITEQSSILWIWVRYMDYEYRVILRKFSENMISIVQPLYVSRKMTEKARNWIQEM